MGYGEIGALIDTLEFDTVNCREPCIVHVINNIYAIAYKGPDDDGWIKTIEVLPDGTISDAPIDSLEFDTVLCGCPSMLRIADNVVAVAFTGTDNDGWIKTIEILPNGTISDAPIDSLEFDPGHCTQPYLIHIAGTVYAVIYQAYTARPTIKTIDISENGTIYDTVLDTVQYGDAGGYWPSATKVGPDMYAIAYQGQDLDGYVATIIIEADGNINPGITDIYEFDPVRTDKTRIIHIKDEIYAIIYGHSSEANIIKTIEISQGGTITKAIIDSLILSETSEAGTDIKHISGNIYVAGYSGSANHGWIKTVEILPDGTITDLFIDSLEFDATYALESNILHVDASIYIIAYSGPDFDGWVKTVMIETACGRNMSHLTIMGVG